MKKKAEFKKYRLLQSLKFNSRTGNKRNCCKCWGRTSYEHWRVMSDIVWKLVNQGFECFTEVEFNDGNRADICAISPGGDGYVIEVIKSEPESSYEVKLDKYNIEWIMKFIKTKDFNIDSWEL